MFAYRIFPLKSRYTIPGKVIVPIVRNWVIYLEYIHIVWSPRMAALQGANLPVADVSIIFPGI